MFRDENERIIRKSKAAQERSRAQQASARQSETSQAGGVTRVQGYVGRPMPMISLDIDGHGLQFFLRHFSNEPGNVGSFSVGRQQNPVQALNCHAPLQNAIISVGLAACSNVKRDRALMSVARQRYRIALSTVRKIVENPVRLDVGPLLKLIAMLAMFEMVDSRPDTMKGWATHLSGVAALMKRLAPARGPEFDTEALLWYFSAVALLYLQAGGPFPAQLNSWPTQRAACVTTDESRTPFDLMDIIIGFVRFCADFWKYEGDTEKVLHEALALEIELQSWVKSLQERWSFTVKETETADTAGTFYGRYHIYHDSWAARTLNHYQMCRLLANEIIVAHISDLSEPSGFWLEQSQRSLKVISQMATEICAGIATQGFFADPADSSQSGTPRQQMKGVFAIQYPMTLAASATGVSDELRSWAIEKLQTMWNRTGIRHALDSVSRIENAIANQAQGKLGSILSVLHPLHKWAGD
ncbi:hypothetical protein BDV18DRAFT_157748 [Aspergillus unguis]